MGVKAGRRKKYSRVHVYTAVWESRSTAVRVKCRSSNLCNLIMVYREEIESL